MSRTLSAQWRVEMLLFETMTCSVEGTSSLGDAGMKHETNF